MKSWKTPTIYSLAVLATETSHQHLIRRCPEHGSAEFCMLTDLDKVVSWADEHQYDGLVTNLSDDSLHWEQYINNVVHSETTLPIS